MPLLRPTPVRRRHHQLFLLVVAVLALPAVAGAQPRAVGPHLVLDHRDDGDQVFPSVAVAPDGGFVATWVHRSIALYARSFGPDGEPRSPLLLLDDQIPFDGLHTGAEIAVDPAGRFVVVWEGLLAQSFSVGIFTRRFAADGTPLGPRFLVHSRSSQFRTGGQLAMAPSGEYLVAWSAGLPQGGLAVFARRFDAEGRAGGVFPVTPEATSYVVEDVAWNGDGQALFVLAHYPESQLRHVDVRGWDAQDGRLGALERLTTAPEGEIVEGAARVVPLADGGFEAIWVRDFSSHPAENGIYGRHVSAAGVPDGPAVQLAAGRAVQASLAALDDGFLVAWQAVLGSFVRAGFTRAFDAAGQALGPIEDFPPMTPGVFALRVDVASHPTGGVVAVWVGEGRRVLATRFADDCHDPDALCLLDRFRVEVEWADFTDGSGAGVPVPRDDTWGTFWFFHPDNVELAVKTVDACALDGRVWLFFGSLTNVEFALVVSDTLLGDRRVYRNPSGTFASRGDTAAFRALPPPGGACAGSSAGPSAAGGAARAAAQQATGGTIVATSGLLRLPVAAPLTPAIPCTADATTLCLDGDRFAARVDWRDFFGNRGAGRTLPLSRDSGAFWFFRPDNPELFVKVLDGTTVNGHHWVFYGALTNVEFELTVHDTQEGGTARYHNPLGHFASRGDTTALP